MGVLMKICISALMLLASNLAFAFPRGHFTGTWNGIPIVEDFAADGEVRIGKYSYAIDQTQIEGALSNIVVNGHVITADWDEHELPSGANLHGRAQLTFSDAEDSFTG